MKSDSSKSKKRRRGQELLQNKNAVQRTEPSVYGTKPKPPTTPAETRLGWYSFLIN